MKDLGAFLKEAAESPWIWGKHDCCALPARWAGVPLPAYGSEADADAMIAKAGGLAPLWDHYGAGIIDRIDGELLAGDVGVIAAVAPDHRVIQIGAIWNGRRWSFVPRAGGIAGASATALAAWRPRCLKL